MRGNEILPTHLSTVYTGFVGLYLCHFFILLFQLCYLLRYKLPHFLLVDFPS